MNQRLKKLFSSVLSVCMLVSVPLAYGDNPASLKTSAGNSMTVEYLERGISAINTGSGMLVSWRYLADDDNNAEFKLYRDNNLVYTSSSGKSTCYLDKEGNASSVYKVETISGGNVVSTDTCRMISNNSYFDIKMDVPPAGSDYTYSPNDCSVGDVDGDGQYEIFVKWDPSNSKDNSQKGKTGNVYIDCYRLDGTKLWRIDLGKNIRAGAHYTQFLVADFDLDGKAEMTCKTADGTVDGQGNVIGDGSKDYRNSNGYILSGNEYYTLFDGATGKALDTVNYEYPRGNVSKWGDKYGNRVDRFLGAVCYLDGNKPSAVSVRGYYTRMTAVAYDVVDKKLVKRWGFDTGNSSSAQGYGDGNHNCMPADVDGDGKQELILGSTCLDDNGKVLWCYNKGHGDAIHVGDLLPDRKGIEVWICHEDKPYGVSLLDGANGSVIFHKNGSGDTGRCCADNVWSGNDGAEFWGLGNDVFDGAGNLLSCRRPAINFLSYWDGDLEREILDGYTDSPAKISKMKADGTLTNLLQTDGYYTCNTTKGTPCLSADIFGDWREELIVRAADSKSIRIYCTPYETDYRITTLMHDPQYRNQVAGQNTAYNQPPHASFYLGSEKPLPAKPSVTVPGKGTVNPAPTEPTQPDIPEAEVLTEGAVYMIKNVNSGLYMEVQDASDTNGANVQQWGADGASAHNTWRAVSAGDGYYYLIPQLGDKASKALDVTAKKPDNGTNMEIYAFKGNDAQKFKFTKNSDGSYKILTKVSSDKSCIEVVNADKSSGANIQEYEINGASCQNWILEQVENSGAVMDTSVSYMFKNANSELYMEVKDANASDNANVQQWGASGSANHNTWTLKEFGGGYYYIISQLADGKTYYLNITDNSGNDGGNAEILTDNKTSSHLFKFVKNTDGTYNILTRASRDKCGLEVTGAETSNGSNIQQWTINGLSCQKWILETIEPPVTEPPTTTQPAVITTVPVETTQPSGSEYVPGDANLDGKVEIADIVAMSSYIGDSQNNPLDVQAIINSDVQNRGDGLTAGDVLAVQQYIANIITTLPV